MSRLRLPGVRLCRGAFVLAAGMLRGFACAAFLSVQSDVAIAARKGDVNPVAGGDDARIDEKRGSGGGAV